ncbi:hypothetical protein V1951_19805 [Yersinia sp. 2544 StPb PI]|uniref:hypothetical protein n=1 Tax=unclassified Yersinia (in: enterobacteria) TaxID=2653513 RepID=UPI00187D1618
MFSVDIVLQVPFIWGMTLHLPLTHPRVDVGRPAPQGNPVKTLQHPSTGRFIVKWP